MKKEFKPFDKVLYKSERDKKWHCRYYDHWDEGSQLHLLTDDSKILDSNILPYEGNECLVGTDLPADEEVRLEEGEWILTGDFIEGMERGCCSLGKFIRIESETFIKESCEFREIPYRYAIRFKDFDPSNMEETKKHILCVKGGKIMKYKD